MFVIVLRAFAGALFTYHRTKCTDIFNAVAVHAHQLCCCITHCGTFHIQADAARHCSNMFFFGTGAGAMITQSSTPKAGFNTRLVVVVIVHNYNIYSCKGIASGQRGFYTINPLCLHAEQMTTLYRPA
jgi:hypothetical protein